MVNKRIQLEKYSYCASLGWFCGTASAMIKNGLRFFSGPFDWYYSDFSSVLSMMENDFSDFLSKDNLRIVEGEPGQFYDTKYGFLYNHDVKEDFEKEYDLIVSKYRKRINRFLSAITRPTCFFRAVRSETEIKYIIEHRNYINQIIKQSNPDNTIVYLLLSGMPALQGEMYFYLNIDRYVGDRYEMLTMFDQSENLLDYCAELIDERQKKANLDFSRQFALSQNQKAELLLRDASLREKLGSFFRGKELYVWGAGQYGIKVENILTAAGIKILGFLDNAEEKAGTCINNIKVYQFKNVENIKTIFIATAYADVSAMITEQIRLNNPNIELYTWSSVWESFPMF
ncbi:MAG: DUF1796 family putative cysteine peptidase [bacterium]|nr:DUF1796 family putative cysteine peptidase [bacterium]